jgi:hypothetical protein
MRCLAHRLHLENLFLEFLDRQGAFQTREQFATLPVLIANTTDDGAVNYDTIYIFLKKNDRNPAAILKKGQWSDWIRVSVNGAETQFKLRLLSLSKDRLEIYTTPLFQSSFSPQIPFTYPPIISSELSKEIGQYVVQEVGWKICKDEVALDLLYEHIEDVSTQQVRASEYLLKTFPDWKLFVHIFTESDRIMHSYWKYFQPEFYHFVDENLARVHGEKINSIIEKIDADIGKFLAHVDKNTTVAVVSDHGFQAKTGKDEGGHNLEGIYIFSGTGIKNPNRPMSLNIKSFPEASLLDITPTILYLMGYPIGRDMDGRVLLKVIEEEKLKCCPAQFTDSYESNSLKKGRVRQAIDKSTESQLRSLGYIE